MIVVKQKIEEFINKIYSDIIFEFNDIFTRTNIYSKIMFFMEHNLTEYVEKYSVICDETNNKNMSKEFNIDIYIKGFNNKNKYVYSIKACSNKIDLKEIIIENIP